MSLHQPMENLLTMTLATSMVKQCVIFTYIQIASYAYASLTSFCEFDLVIYIQSNDNNVTK